MMYNIKDYEPPINEWVVVYESFVDAPYIAKWDGQRWEPSMEFLDKGESYVPLGWLVCINEDHITHWEPTRKMPWIREDNNG